MVIDWVAKRIVEAFETLAEVVAKGSPGRKGIDAVFGPPVEIQSGPLVIAREPLDADRAELHRRSPRDLERPFGNIDPVTAHLIAGIDRTGSKMGRRLKPEDRNVVGFARVDQRRYQTFESIVAPRSKPDDCNSIGFGCHDRLSRWCGPKGVLIHSRMK